MTMRESVFHVPDHEKEKIPNFSLAGVIKPIRHLLLAEKSTMKYLFPCTRTVKSTETI